MEKIKRKEKKITGLAAVKTEREINDIKIEILNLLSQGKSVWEYLKEKRISTKTFFKWREIDKAFNDAVAFTMNEKKHKNFLTEQQNRFKKFLPLQGKDTVKAVQDVCAALQNGAPFEVACLYANVTPRALQDLMRRDDEVMDAINKSEASFVLKQTQSIIKKNDADWKSSAWLLERRYPKMYGQRNIEDEPRRVTTVECDTPLQLETDWNNVTDEELFNK